MRAEFEAQIASAPLVEFQARHILVSSEDVAMKIIAQLKAGNDFAALAKRLSADTQSAAKGGDLGWFGPRDMDPSFTNAVALLKKGEFTKTPVQTAAGWHVIQLQNTRDRTPPAYDDVKDRLAKIVVAKKFKAHSDEMLKTAKIEPPLTTVPVAAPAAPAPAAAACSGSRSGQLVTGVRTSLQPPRPVQTGAGGCFVFRICSSAASSRIRTPSDCALASFEPASAPTTRKLVFFDTLPDTFAPSARSASSAASRCRPASVPVITKVRPASGRLARSSTLIGS